MQPVPSSAQPDQATVQSVADASLRIRPRYEPRPRQLATYQAVYRLGARPYALSHAFGAAGRMQYAVVFHAASAVNLVKLRSVQVAVESTSVAGLVVADLVRLTGATLPASGNPAVTAQPFHSADPLAEATCLALPTTAGTETTGPVSMAEWNLGITGSAPTLNPPPALNWQTLWTDPAEEEEKGLYIRPGNAEGWAVTLDCSSASTVKAFVIVRFTEETPS